MRGCWMQLRLSKLLQDTCCGALADKCELVSTAKKYEQYIIELETIIDGFVEEEVSERVRDGK